jgi:hypothetical protein
MPEWRHESRAAEQMQSPYLSCIDGESFGGTVIADECHDTLLAHGRVAHDAFVAADGERVHAGIISGACDGIRG